MTDPAGNVRRVTAGQDADRRIESALAELARTLPSDAASADLLDEVRDHLLCEAEADGQPGPDDTGGPAVGARAGVAAAADPAARFGDLSRMGREWAAELRFAAVRRAANAVLRLVTVAASAWLFVLVAGVHGSWPGHRPAQLGELEEVGGVSALVTLGASVCGVLAVVLAARWVSVSRPSRLLGAGAAGTTALALVAGTVGAAAMTDLLTRRAIAAPGSLSLLDVAIASACTLAALAAAAPALIRAGRLLLTRRPPARRTGPA